MPTSLLIANGEAVLGGRDRGRSRFAATRTNLCDFSVRSFVSTARTEAPGSLPSRSATIESGWKVRMGCVGLFVDPRLLRRHTSAELELHGGTRARSVAAPTTP